MAVAPEAIVVVGSEVPAPGLPMPRSPSVLPPQHFTSPLVSKAQLKSKPTAMSATPLSRPETSTGVDDDTCELSPSWPLSLLPQHFAAPPMTAQPCKAVGPRATRVAPLTLDTT